MSEMKRVRKTPGPEYPDGPARGFCYDGTGWFLCDFWAGHNQANEKNPDGPSRCLLFGGAQKQDAAALRCCDKIYGVHYDGDA